jgi:hypothetical protein
VNTGDKVRLSPKFKRALCRQEHNGYFTDSRKHLSKFKNSIGTVAYVSSFDIAVDWEVPPYTINCRAHYKVEFKALELVF